MHWSRFAPPNFLLHRLFPVSDPLSYHRTTSYTYSSPEEHIDFILSANSKPVPWNYKIRKLLDATLVSSTERFRYALGSSQRLTDEGRRALACTHEATSRLLQSTKELDFIRPQTWVQLKIRGRIYHKWRGYPQISRLNVLCHSQPDDDLLTIQLQLSAATFGAVEGSWGPKLGVFLPWLWLLGLTRKEDSKTGPSTRYCK